MVMQLLSHQQSLYPTLLYFNDFGQIPVPIPSRMSAIAWRQIQFLVQFLGPRSNILAVNAMLHDLC